MKTATKRDLMEMLKDVPDDANVYVMTSKTGASRAVEAATGEDLVFLIGGNTAFEADGVSLVADFDFDRK
jgi:hypothetical protein